MSNVSTISTFILLFRIAVYSQNFEVWKNCYKIRPQRTRGIQWNSRRFASVELIRNIKPYVTLHPIQFSHLTLFDRNGFRSAAVVATLVVGGVLEKQSETTARLQGARCQAECSPTLLTRFPRLPSSKGNLSLSVSETPLLVRDSRLYPRLA